jgi:hypothetical protein
MYIAVPRARKELFEKQLTSIYPAVRLTVRGKTTTTPLRKDAQIAAAVAKAKRALYLFTAHVPISFTSDPLEVLLNSFSKLQR